MMLPMILTFKDVFRLEYSLEPNGKLFKAWGQVDTLPALPLPWAGTLLEDTITLNDLDMHFYDSYGQRIISPFLRRVIKSNGGTIPIPVTDWVGISRVCYRKLYHTLRQEALALGAEYNPINNYDMTEDGSDSDTHSGTDTTTHTATEYTQTTTDDVTGFDSTGDGVQANKSTSDVRQGTKPGEDSTEYGHVISREHSLSRSGNIGVTTSQQMIQSELDLRCTDYWDRVCEHVAEILTIPMYN